MTPEQYQSILDRHKDEVAKEWDYTSFSSIEIEGAKKSILEIAALRAMREVAQVEANNFGDWLSINCRMIENDFSLYNLNEDTLEIRKVSELYEVFKLFKTPQP